MKVYKAINAVQSDLAQTGITKDRRNQQQGYSFRGIDDVFNALSPLLAKHGLCILPRVVSRECIERQTMKGGTLFYVTVGVEFDFVCAEDGSIHMVKTFGEAMDSADKATNKAMSAAYKYAAFQAFAIPTEGDNDADSHTPDVKPARPAKPQPVKAAPVDASSALQINVPDDASDWVQAAIDATHVTLDFATTSDEVMEIYKLNRNVYDRLKQDDVNAYDTLMKLFKTMKESLSK